MDLIVSEKVGQKFYGGQWGCCQNGWDWSRRSKGQQDWVKTKRTGEAVKISQRL